MAHERPENPLIFIGSHLLKHNAASEESETAADTAEDYSSEVESEEDVVEPDTKKKVPIWTEGVLECSPLSMKFTDLSRLAFYPECQYGMSFAFVGDIDRTGSTFNGSLNQKNGAY